MEQQIRYCKTSDGVDIAYSTSRRRSAARDLAEYFWYRTCRWSRTTLPARAFFERLSRRVQVVRYDRRGTGMSQRGVADFSDEAGSRDLRAVVDRLELARFALYTHLVAGDAPLAFPPRSTPNA